MCVCEREFALQENFKGFGETVKAGVGDIYKGGFLWF